MNAGEQLDERKSTETKPRVADPGMLSRRRRTGVWIALMALLLVGSIAYAQFRGRRGSRRGNGDFESNVSSPSWTNPKAFKHDVFTFARIEYDSDRGGWGSGRGWSTDYSDADINLLFRLQQITSMKVNDDPEGRHLRLTDPDLYKYPFIYIVEPGGLYLSDLEAERLRKHLLNGGFLMLDDFWGERAWENMESQIKKAFPDREFADLPANHPIFNGVFRLDKDKLQTPSVDLGMQSEYDGVTWERPDAREVHFRGLYDDKGRLMLLACHNTDNGDGWEREGFNEYFFREFSSKKNYPLAVNIVLYMMSH